MFKGHKRYPELNAENTANLDKIVLLLFYSFQIEELNIKLSQVMKENEFLKAENNKMQRITSDTQTKYLALQQKYKNLKIRFVYFYINKYM